ncbi:MAG: Periplasmic protein thiol/disulfide oxidoreductase DsbE [uncultured bacterium]|nr:MAG: Periplasmic protein thiol/disulfide oxidoreductase DsbE [uncultured bacterium]
MRLLIALPLILFAGIVLLLWHGLKLQPNQIPSPLINQAAPTFQLPTLLGARKITSSQDLRGHVTLVNVFASWCAACAEEQPFLLQLAKNEHVFFYGLNYKDDELSAKKWLRQYGNPYQIIAVDTMGKEAIDWGVYGTPETFVLDKKGVIRYKQIGVLDQETWEKKIFPLLKQLRNESA